MTTRAFVDSNVLVYAHDRGAGSKRERARELLARLWGERSGVVSTQVLQEFCVNVRRVAENPLPADEAKALVAEYLRWELIVNEGDSVLEAVDLERRFHISFRDALIVQAANAGEAEILYSEDLNHGQLYGATRVIDPFRG